MSKQSGFTVIEMFFVAAIFMVAGVFFFIQKRDIESYSRDAERKTDINALYYGLEESFYKEHKYYPEKLDKDSLKVVDPEAFIDPNGKELGGEDSALAEYRYEPNNCKEQKCKGYSLRAYMEKEGEFIKKNRELKKD